MAKQHTGKSAKPDALPNESGQLRAILDAVDEGVILIDITGKVVYVNRRAKEDVGASVVGKDALSLVDMLNIATYPAGIPINKNESMVAQSIATGVPLEFVRYVDTTRGAKRVIRFNIKPIYQNDTVTSQVVSYRDISRRKTSEAQLEESEQRYKSVVERMNEGLIVVDNDNIIKYVNPRFCKLLGYKREELLGKVSYQAVRILNFSDEAFASKVAERKKGKHEVYDILMRQKNGEPRWFKVSASPVYDSQNKVVGSMGIHTDITEKKKSTEENERLLTIIDSSTDYVWMVDRVGSPIYINRALRKVMGIKKGDDISGWRASDFYTPQSFKTFIKEVMPALKSSKGSWSGELSIRTAKKTEVLTSEVIVCGKNEQGEIEYTAVVARDISEIKNAQREIAILARMPDENPSPMLRVDINGQVVYANAASQILLKVWKTKVGGKLPDIWCKAVRKVLQTGHFKEYEADFGRKVFDLKMIPVPEYDYVNIITSDITHRKKADEQLRASEKKYRAIVEDQTEMISRFLGDGTITFANKAYCRYYGLDPDRVVGTSIFSVVPEQFSQDLKTGLSRLSVDEPVATYSVFLEDSTNPRWQLWTDRAIYDDNNLFIEYQSVGQDITSLKQAELKLKRQELYLRKIIDTLPNLVYVKNSMGEYQMVNRAFGEFLGKSISSIIGKTDVDMFGDVIATNYVNADSEILDTESTLINPEDKLLGKDGRVHWFHTVKTPLITDSFMGKQVLGVSTEVTDRKMFEDALRFQLEFKELISFISTRFINLSHSEIDEGIKESLKQIGEFDGADRVRITLLDAKQNMEQEYGWVLQKGGWKELPETATQVPRQEVESWVKTLQQQGHIHVPDMGNYHGEVPGKKYANSKQKVLSFIMLPLQSKNHIIGFLSLSRFKAIKRWSDDNITLLKIISQVFSNALERKSTESLLNFTLGFENIVTTVSANFINIKPEAINAEINASLKYVAQYLLVDQGYVFLTAPDSDKLKLTYHWLPDGVAVVADHLKQVEQLKHSWAIKQLRQEGVLGVPDVESLPPAAADIKRIMEAAKVKSLVGVPIFYSGTFTGVLLFGSFRRENFWPEEAIPLLKIFGQTLANALDRKRTDDYLNETREQYRTLARNIPKSAVMLFDKNLRYQLVEGAALEDQGYSREGIEGRTIYEVLSPSRVRSLEPVYKEALNGKQTTLERDYNGKHYLIHILPVKNEHGETYAGMVMSLDISDIHTIQLQLEEQTKELKRSNEDLELFAYAASHDLQEPLRMVSSYIHLIQRKLGKLEPDIEEFMDYAVDGVKRMQELINDLLEYSRVDRRASFQEVDMAKIAKLVEINLRNAIEAAGVTLVVAENMPRIVADQSQIISLFQNLVENGIKFSTGSQRFVEIGYLENKHNWHFFVKDNGIGIESKFFERIFIIFQRLNGRNEFDGTGIGLAICRKIAERHKGRIWVESELGKGTTFHIEVSKSLK